MRCVRCGEETNRETLQLVVKQDAVRGNGGRITGTKRRVVSSATVPFCDGCCAETEPFWRKSRRKAARRKGRLLRILLTATALGVCGAACFSGWPKPVLAAAVPAAVVWAVWLLRLQKTRAETASSSGETDDERRAELCEFYLNGRMSGYTRLLCYRIRPVRQNEKRRREAPAGCDKEIAERIVSEARFYYDDNGERMPMQPESLEEVIRVLSWTDPFCPDNPNFVSLLF